MKQSGKKAGAGKLTKKKAVIAAVVLVAVIAAASRILGGGKETAGDGAQEQKTAAVERRDVTSTLSASGSLEAKDSYNITSLVEGEVLAADFEEGDQVTKGQVLYQIDSSSMESQLTSSRNSLQRAQDSLADAQDRTCVQIMHRGMVGG
mgnify:CR=1 FL=1